MGFEEEEIAFPSPLMLRGHSGTEPSEPVSLVSIAGSLNLLNDSDARTVSHSRLVTLVQGMRMNTGTLERSLFLLASLSLAGCALLDPNPAQPANSEPKNSPTPAPAAAEAKPDEASFRATSQEGGGLAQEVERARLREEKKKFLLGQYLTQGQEAYLAGKLSEAMQAYTSALEVDPENAEAQDGLRKVRASLGKPAEEAGEFVKDTRDRDAVRRAEAQLAAEQSALDGDQAMKNGEYARAVLKYRETLLILRYHPMVSSGGLDRNLLEDKLRQAISARETGTIARKAEVDVKVREEQERKEKARKEYVEKKIASLFENANTAFLNERYREAEVYLDQLLTLDPENQDAIQLRDTAVAQRHATVDRNNRAKYKEEWQKTFERLASSDLPQSQSIEFNLKRWAEVSKRKPIEVAGPEPTQSPEDMEIVNKLSNAVFPPRFEDASIEEVISFLQNLTGVNFLVSNAVRDLDPEKKKIRLELPDTSVKKLLDILPDVSSAGLRYRIQHGLVQIITAEELKGGQFLAFYEVQDIVKSVPNFPAPEVNLAPSGGVEAVEEELPERDSFIINGDTLVTLIKGNVAPESWEADPKNTVQIQRGTLIVSQTREVQDKIKNLLKDLREATGIMVDVQARFLTVEDNFLQDIGVDFRGLGDDAAAGVAGAGADNDFDDFGTNLPTAIGNGNDSGAFYSFKGDSDIRARAENLYDLGLGKQDVLTGSGGLSFQMTFLDNIQLEVILRAVQKSERVQIINAPRLLVFNTERASIRVLDKVSYIRDYDVQIAQASVIADPVVDWINAGTFLDVTPVVSSDRRFITMELRPTVATLKRPIRVLPTNLATGSPVNIMLPELEVQRVRTTVSIPDGGTLLLAGSSIVEKQDYESGVPFLSKMPIVGFLFSRKGEFNRNKKLLILLRAKVVIPEEYEPVVSDLR